MLRRVMPFVALALGLLLSGALYVAAGPSAQEPPTPTQPGILPAPGAPPVTVPAPTPSLTPFGGIGTPVPMGGESSDGGILATPTITPTFTPTPPPRVTILLMGGDRRPDEPANLFRTDVMMLISLDRTNERIGVLSIPRDLYVTIPGYRSDRINTAYASGQYTGQGSALAMQTVAYNFGVQVDAYVAFDFEAFIALIDVIDGIDVVVEEPIADPLYPSMNYGYEPFYLEAGPQHLDGETALKYVRTRHNSDDRERMRRQQQVIAAVREKIGVLELGEALLRFGPALWTQLRENIDTDLTLDEILRLGAEINAVPSENYNFGVLSYPYVYATMINEQSVLVPDFSLISGLVAQVFGTSSYAW